MNAGVLQSMKRPVSRIRRRLALVIMGCLALAALVAGVAFSGTASPPTWTMVVPVPSQDAIARDTAVEPVRAAPPLRLTDQDGRPFDLASLRGTHVFVFFGYTHCPDVCPTSLADLRDALKASPIPARVVFVTVDPERDTPAALKQYLGYFNAGFIGLTGTAQQIRAAADAWGVQYARVDPEPGASGYAMAHTADTYLVDAAGLLRHRIWFGAGPAVFDDRLAQVAQAAIASGAATATPPAPPSVAPPSGTVPPSPAPPSAAPSAASPSPTPAFGTTAVMARLQTTVVRVGMNRLVITVADPNNRELAFPQNTAHLTFRPTSDPTAASIEADAFQIWVQLGAKGAYVVDVDFPSQGAWQSTIAISGPGGPIGAGDFFTNVREGWSVPQVGDPAPSIHTPTIADAGGLLANVTTDVFPDPRLYQWSVDQLLAQHRPFMLVFYSPAWCPTTACGPLLKFVKEMADEFPNTAFVHVEPHVMLNYGERLVPDYSSGQLTFNDAARAYGIPVEPYVFVVDAGGKIASTFELIVGSDELRAAIRAAGGS